MGLSNEQQTVKDMAEKKLTPPRWRRTRCTSRVLEAQTRQNMRLRWSSSKKLILRNPSTLFALARFPCVGKGRGRTLLGQTSRHKTEAALAESRLQKLER